MTVARAMRMSVGCRLVERLIKLVKLWNNGKVEY